MVCISVFYDNSAHDISVFYCTLFVGQTIEKASTNYDTSNPKLTARAFDFSEASLALPKSKQVQKWFPPKANLRLKMYHV